MVDEIENILQEDLHETDKELEKLEVEKKFNFFKREKENIKLSSVLAAKMI